MTYPFSGCLDKKPHDTLKNWPRSKWSDLELVCIYIHETFLQICVVNNDEWKEKTFGILSSTSDKLWLQTLLVLSFTKKCR